MKQTTGAGAWPGKRALDVVGALVLLVVLLPVLVAVATAVKVGSPGPVLFRHRRVGRDGRSFGVLKFRSMEVGAEQRLVAVPALGQAYVGGDYKLALDDDPRITPLGRVLRATSLDELPQLLNVLAGHMSLVGPRPVVPDELGRYGDHLDAYLSRRPGLTGLWQVSGRNDVTFPERAELDAEYGRRCSPGLDLRILASTPAAVLRRRGVR